MNNAPNSSRSPLPARQSSSLLNKQNLFALACALACVAWGGCSSDPPAPLASLRSPSRIAFAPQCIADGRWWPTDQCPDTATPIGRGYLLNEESAAMSFVDISGREPSLIDVKQSVPGVTGIPIGDRPTQLASTPDGAFILTINALSHDLSLVEVDRRRELARFSIPSLVGSADVVALDLINDPTHNRFWLSLSDGRLLSLALAFDCGSGPNIYSARDTATGAITCDLSDTSVTLTPQTTLVLPGTPAHLLVDPARAALYVAYSDQVYLSVIGLEPIPPTDPATPETPAETCLDTAAAVPCEVARLPGGLGCADGLDNDADGLFDAADPQCFDRTSSESLSDPGVLFKTECYDGLDNDDDGLTDLFDLGCLSANDGSEADDLQTPTLPPCVDGLDNDADGLTDNRDPDCKNPEGDESGFLPFVAACDNGFDDDADNLVDLDDPDCSSALDNTEAATAACNNGLDDDGDGLVDLADLGCDSRSDDTEQPTLAACGNGLDDDGDNLIDTADPGCLGVWGATEADIDRAGLGPLGIDPRGRWLYVVDRSEWSVLVIDLASRTLLPGGLQNPLSPGAGIRVNPLPMAVAGDIRSGTIADDGAGTTLKREDAVFLVATTAGTLDSGLVQQTFTRTVPNQPDEVLNILPLIVQDSRTEQSSPRSLRCIKGRCLGEVILEVILRRRTLVDVTDGLISTKDAEGNLLTRPADDIFRGEVWSMVFEGILPGSERSDALISLDEPDKIEGRGANFCNFGVEPGDRFIIKGFPTDGVGNVDQNACGDFLNDDGSATTLEWEITHVRRNALYLAPVPEEGFAQALPTRECFNQGINYEIRAPQTWVVSGEDTNVLLSLESDGEICTAPRLDFLGSGRLKEGTRYENAFFEFTLTDGAIEDERDQGLQFELRSGYLALRRAIGGFPSDVKVLDNGQRRFVFVPDADRNQVLIYDADSLGQLDPL